MIRIKATSFPYTILHQAAEQKTVDNIYPYLRYINGDMEMLCISPHHGRSFVVDTNKEGRFVVSKGNGLSYTQMAFINTGEFGDDTYGLLLRQDAERDFFMGQEAEALGLKTNHMEYVIELEKEFRLSNGHTIKPTLLQYNVECPYRICDAPFMTNTQIWNEVAKWERMNDKCFDKDYLIAANVLIRNLRILHDHNFLHNAIHEQNYTWALELLDFELACSPNHPYSSEDDQRHVKSLFSREILQTYGIINYIAGVLHEDIDFALVDALFEEYDFNIKRFQI